MKITTIGIDLAKEVFQVHGVDGRGKAVLRKQLKRKDMAKFFANIEPCLIGMEACCSAYHWARKLGEYGHTVKLMAPQFVKPYVKTNKNDVADAEAICEAVNRPNMRFVPVKNVEQQAVLSVHRARHGFVQPNRAGDGRPWRKSTSSSPPPRAIPLYSNAAIAHRASYRQRALCDVLVVRVWGRDVYLMTE